MLENAATQTYKFITKNCVEINYDACRKRHTNSCIKIKTTIVRSSLYDYSDAYIRHKGNEKAFIKEADAAAVPADRNSNKVIFKKKKIICFLKMIKNKIICFRKMIKNAFYFILKALFILKIFKFLSRLFGHIEKTA